MGQRQQWMECLLKIKEKVDVFYKCSQTVIITYHFVRPSQWEKNNLINEVVDQIF